MRIRPLPLAVMWRTTRLAMCTSPVMLIAMSLNLSSRSLSMNAPPRPMPTLSAAASTGRPKPFYGSPESFHAVVGASVGLIGISLYASGAELLG
jgi:hypothetical protein